MFIVTLSGRPGGYPEDNFIIKKKGKKKKEVIVLLMASFYRFNDVGFWMCMTSVEA